MRHGTWCTVNMIDALAIVILREISAGERLEACVKGSGAATVGELAQGAMDLSPHSARATGTNLHVGLGPFTSTRAY